MQEVRVAFRLFLHTFTGIDDEDRGVGLRSASDHVFQKFPMARSVDQHILAKGSTEVNMRDVNGNTLVSFRLKRIHEECPLERHAAPLAHSADSFKLSFRQRTRVVKQAAD
jgi:hypothetical protein